MDKIERIQPSSTYAIPGIKAAARVGNLLFVSGQVPLGPTGTMVGIGDFRMQAEQVFSNLGAALEAGGSGFDRVINLTSFFTDIARDLPVYREVRDRHIASEHATASSAIQVAQLFHPAAWLEVEAIALCGS
jgi:2-iminobutanoate/2-iminopropanoate deaminase